jgi:hypothetical protein
LARFASRRGALVYLVVSLAPFICCDSHGFDCLFSFHTGIGNPGPHVLFGKANTPRAKPIAGQFAAPEGAQDCY